MVVRTKSKHEYSLENIYESYAPIVENIEADEDKVKASLQALTRLASAVKDVGLLARKLGKCRKELANQLRILRYYFGRPTSTLVENKYVVGDVLRNLCEVISKQV